MIEDQDYAMKVFGETPDTVRFVDDLRWTDFDFLRDGASDTLTMRVKGTDDQLTFVDFTYYIFIVGFTNLIEDITFADGTNWSYLKFLQHYVDTAKTAGDDAIYGFNIISDFLDGGAGG